MGTTHCDLPHNSGSPGITSACGGGRVLTPIPWAVSRNRRRLVNLGRTRHDKTVAGKSVAPSLLAAPDPGPVCSIGGCPHGAADDGTHQQDHTQRSQQLDRECLGSPFRQFVCLALALGAIARGRRLHNFSAHSKRRTRRFRDCRRHWWVHVGLRNRRLGLVQGW